MFPTVNQVHSEQRPHLSFIFGGLCCEGQLLLLELALVCVISYNLFIIKCPVMEIYLDTISMHLALKVCKKLKEKKPDPLPCPPC